MIIESLKELFTRDLNKLKNEIQLYKDETVLWEVENSISNSGGNLCLHIVGNLKTFIGDGLGKTGYVRQRDFEFSGKGIERGVLLSQIDETIQAVDLGLSTVTDEQLEGNFPILIWEKETGMAFTLIHLHCHLNYHLGQVNYHRRLLDQKG